MDFSLHAAPVFGVLYAVGALIVIRIMRARLIRDLEREEREKARG